jgi:predicted nucleotidyltransferase
MDLPPEVASALRQVREVLPSEVILVVGATALRRHLCFDYRHSHDLDLAISLSISDFPGPLTSIAGWIHAGERAPHRFRTERGLQLDILPTKAAGDVLTWPDGFEMSLVGFDLAFEFAEPVSLEPDLEVLFPTAPTILLLKMSSWQDRPHDRQKDLVDICKLFERYLSDDDERHWSDALLASGVDHELHSAYALGLDLRRITRPSHRRLVQRFLAASPEYHLPLSLDPEAEEARARRFLESFRAGFDVP